MQGQGQRRREEEGHRQHMRRVVMEMQISISGIAHPIEVTEYPVRKAMPPSAHQKRTEHHKCGISENRKAERDGHMIPHAQLAANFHLAQRPTDERTKRTDRYDLP